MLYCIESEIPSHVHFLRNTTLSFSRDILLAMEGMGQRRCQGVFGANDWTNNAQDVLNALLIQRVVIQLGGGSGFADPSIALPCMFHQSKVTCIKYARHKWIHCYNNLSVVA